MPYPGNGFTGGTGGTDSPRPPLGGGGGTAVRSKTPTFEKTKSVSYNATTSDQIFAISATPSSTESKEQLPNAIEVQNTGGVPIFLMIGYREWTTETADAGSAEGRFEYLHIMLMPGETFSPPVRGVIRTGETDGTQSKIIMDGTVVDNAAPNSNMYADIDTVGNVAFDVTTDPVSFDVTDGDFWRVGDMMRCQAEIVQITAISGNTVTVNRGMLGTSAVAHGDGETLRLQFSNDYHDFDRYSVAQTDSNGRFKCTNFFGVGRAASGVQGIVPGSVAIKFYQPGYQELGMAGITSSTNTGLTAGDEYKFDITVDGAGLHNNLAFTIDSSNTNFGGTNGVISKIQAAFDEQYYTAGNLFEEKVIVGIVGGDIRFTSGQRLSTSAILLAAPTSGTTPFGVGRFPAIGSIDAAVAARLPDDVTYDRITYATIPNSGAFGYDDGNSRLFGMCGGTINYETGAINMTGCPANAEFVVSCLHSSAFSGKLNEGTDERINSIADIYANTPSQKWNGSVVVRTF